MLSLWGRVGQYFFHTLLSFLIRLLFTGENPVDRRLRNFLNINKHILIDCIHTDLNNTILGEVERATRKTP